MRSVHDRHAQFAISAFMLALVAIVYMQNERE